MSSLSTLKAKGQITLPVTIRKRIQAVEGDIFNWQVEGGRVTMVRQTVVPAYQAQNSVKKNLAKWIGAKPGVFKSADEVDSFVRKQRDLWS